jgi:hypothetical protein
MVHLKTGRRSFDMTIPTPIEFRETVRDAFGYLGREFAFREVEPPAKGFEVNPFLIWFVNTTTLVQVEGTNWGFGAEVILGPADAGEEWHAIVPLWAVLQHRRPDLYEQVARSPGQLGMIRTYAHALRETASDVLRGNFGVFRAARAILDAQMLSQDQESRERNYRAAVAGAADAFRGKDFRRVVGLLMPHAKLLTPAERAKLNYARARLGRDDSSEPVQR